MSDHGKLEQTRPAPHNRAVGLVSSRVSGARVESSTQAPAPQLADIVECHWVGRWDLRGQSPHRTELLGDPCLHLVFERDCSRVVGVWTRLWRRTLAEVGLVRASKLRPGAARALLPLAASAYSNKMVPLAEAFGFDARRVGALERKILAPSDDNTAFAELDALLLRLGRPHDVLARSLAVRVMRVALERRELTSVQRLAEIAGLSVRELQRLFREHVGATPKHVLRRFRLQEVALRVERGEADSLAALAADLGYADQAHLARDFKAATGRSLRTFGREVWR